MKLQQLLSHVRKAVDTYHMLEDGDRIAIGISGGKDSLTMLYALHGLQRFYGKHFEIEAITVDLGFPDFDLSPIQALCDELGVRYTIVKTEIYTLSRHDALPISELEEKYPEIMQKSMNGDMSMPCLLYTSGRTSGCSAENSSSCACISASGVRNSWAALDRQSTRLNSSHVKRSRMPSSA